MTADGILDLVRHQVTQLYGESACTYAGYLGELDAVIFNWHWLYAHATGRVDDFVKATTTMPPNDALRLRAITESHETVGASDNTQWIIDRWKKAGDAIGLTPIPEQR